MTSVNPSPTPIDRIVPGRVAKKLLIYLFVDSIFFHKYWHCHCLPGRSFSLRGRQFHICARCTGIVLGIPLSPLAVIAPEWTFPIWLLCISLLLCDGLTQLFGIRQSNNLLRFYSGLPVPLACSALGIAILKSLCNGNGI